MWESGDLEKHPKESRKGEGDCKLGQGGGGKQPSPYVKTNEIEEGQRRLRKKKRFKNGAEVHIRFP